MLKDTEKETRRPKQAAVMQAATELFVQHGYDGTSTEMIAERAGVSRQTIYNQFESKEALFLAIAKNLIHEVAAPLEEALEEVEDLRGTLLALGRRTLTALLRPKTAAFHRLAITEVPRFPELADAIDQASTIAVEVEVAAYLNRQRQLRLPDPKRAAQHFLALIVHPYSFKVLLGIRADVDSQEIAHHLEAAVDAFLRADGSAGREEGARG